MLREGNLSTEIFLDNNTEYKEKKEQLIRTMHRTAQAGLFLEKVLQNNGEPLNKDQFLSEQPIFQELPKKIIDVFRDVIKQYNMETVQASGEEREILKSIGILSDDDLEQTMPVCEPAEFGNKFFKDYTHCEPLREVVMYRKGPSFVLILDWKDWLNFWKKTGKEEMHKDTGGLYTRSFCYKTNKSHRSNKNYISNLIMVKKENFLSTEDSQALRVNQTISHEIQHLINGKFLERFQGTEPRSFGRRIGQFENTESEQRHVKDELIARMKEGDNIDNVESLLAGKDVKDKTECFAYKNLYGPFIGGESREKIRQIVKDVVFEWKEFSKKFNMPATREVLVYHLLTVPLYKMAHRIRTVSEFYEKRLKQFLLVDNTSRTEALRSAFFTDQEPNKSIGNKKIQKNIQIDKLDDSYENLPKFKGHGRSRGNE